MKSIWQQNTERQPAPPLQKNIKTTVAVIGGGLTGILTADALAAEGTQVVVLDASTIGSGQTGRTTAKVTSQHGTIYERLARSFGAVAAAQYAQANEQAISTYRQLIRVRNIRCGWEDTDSCLYSTESIDTLLLQEQAQKNAGLKAVFTNDTQLPFPAKGAVRLSGQGQFHPLQFLYALADNLTIYEYTHILSVEGNRITTDTAYVDAEQIVFCCHYPFMNFPGAYFLRMHQERSYVLAVTAPGKLSAHYYSIDTGGLSLRQTDGLLLLGGGAHRTGECSSTDPYEALRRSASLLFPKSNETAHWSAQDCMTPDGIPYIGQFSAATPNWYVATGFGKWGMSTAMVAARILRDMILGRDTKHDSIFSPQRITLVPSAAAFLEDSLHAVRGLSRELFLPARSAAQTLAPGQGGVVELKGEKVGIYRAEQGDIWVVDVRCPHLGCELTWNPGEKSWDCPCHGSRYDYQGQSLDGPAQTNLPAYHLSEL